MTDSGVASFEQAVAREFAFLEAHGFRRVRTEHPVGPVGASADWVGRHVGFRVTLDARDGVVDARVMTVRDGRMEESGRYASDLFAHLVAHEGYRGAPSGPVAGQAPPGGSTIEAQVAGWARLLRTAGEVLLADGPESLPARGRT